MAVELGVYQTLEQLGVVCYLPTRQLPGAKPSAALVPVTVAYSESERNHSQKPVVQALNDSQKIAGDVPIIATRTDQTTASKAALKPPVIDIQSLLDTPAANPSTQNTAVQPAVAGSANDFSALNFSVKLYVWRVGPLLVIDSSSPASALPTERLLGNILHALNIKSAQLPNADILRWPLVKNNHDKTREPFVQASDMVQAYLIAQAERSTLAGVLAMGTLACQLTLADQSVEQAECRVAKFGQVPVYCVPSLEQLLLEPQKKAGTWACIKPLIQIDNSAINNAE